MRLIDADRLSFVLNKNFGHTGGAAVLQQLIDNSPTVDAVKHGKEKDIDKPVIDKIKDDSLKLCPFCGKEVTVWNTDFGVISIVECEHCKTKFVFPWNRKQKELKDFWNERVN